MFAGIVGEVIIAMEGGDVNGGLSVSAYDGADAVVDIESDEGG